MTDGAGGTPAIGIMLEHELPGKKKLVLQTHVAQDVSPEVFNEVMDKCQRQADRQFAFYMLDPLRRELKTQQRLLEDHVGRIAALEERLNAKTMMNADRRGGYKLSPAEEKEKQQSHAITADIQRRIAELTAELADTEAKAK